jgi:hypothetical protein
VRTPKQVCFACSGRCQPPADEAAAHIGELWLADIGVPPELHMWPSIGMRIRSPFVKNDTVRVA